MSDIVERLRDEAGAGWHADLTRLFADGADEITALRARVAELERSETRLIDQRDAAEHALGLAYSAATGQPPEWSNNFGYAEAVNSIGARVAELEAAGRGILDDYEHIDTDLNSVQALRRALEPRDGR